MNIMKEFISVDEWLDEHLPKLGTRLRKLVKDALAIAAYRTQTAYPVPGGFTVLASRPRMPESAARDQGLIALRPA